MNFTFLPSSSVLIHSWSCMLMARTYNVLNDRCDLSRLWTHGSWALGTKVGSKLFVTVGFVLLFHPVIGQRAHRRAERPSCTRSKRSPENPASQSKPACVAWPQYKPTLCEKEQCSEAAACLQSGRKCPTTQEEEA